MDQPPSRWNYHIGLLFMMTMTNAIVVLDRFGINYLAPYIVDDLGISNASLGLLSSGLSVSVAISGVVLARLADASGRRKQILVSTLIVFSLVSALSGLAPSFAALLMARILLGVPEGPIPAIAQSIVVLESPPRLRGFSMGLVQQLGASLVGDAGFGGVSWSRYESTYGIPAEEEAFIDMKQDRFDAKGEWRPAGAWLDTLHLNGAYSDYTHTEFEAPGVPGTVFNQNSYELRAAADHHWSNDWRGTIGAQYVDIDFEALGEEAFVPASITKATSVFAFEERHFDKWTLELGARAENQTLKPAADTGLPDYDKTAFNFSTGLVFQLADDRALALNLTHTERHPQAAELYANGAHIAAGRVEIGNPDLKKEKALTADLSLRATGDGVRWTLNAFYNDYSDYIYLNPTGELAPGEEEALPIFEYLQAGAKLYGYEAEVIFPLLAATSDNSLELRLVSDYVRGKLDNGRNLPQIPPLRVGAGLHYESGAWHAGLEAMYNTKQDDVIQNELPTDGFTMLDADVSYRLPLGSKHLLLFARGSNLLDKDARLSTSPLKDIAPLPGRSFHLGARAEF